MKYLFLFLSVVLASCSSNSHEAQAQKKVTEKIKSQLNDPESYESVKFSPLFPFYKTDLYKAEILIYEEQIKHGIMVEEYKLKLDSLKPLASAVKNDSTIVKYFIRHEYRAKNGFGGVVTKEEAFEFDTNFVMIER